jgi:hypothetical protein
VFVVGGRRLYGKIEQVGGTYIATTFAFLQFLPLFPVQSHIVVGEGSSGTHEVVHIKMHWRSVAVGYLRAWGIGATLIALVPAIVMASSSSPSTAFAGASVFVACAGLTTAAFAWIGRLSDAEKAQRLIYARFLGHPVDPDVFDEDTLGKVSVRLRNFLEERAVTLASASGYRAGSRVNAGYRAIALLRSTKDREFLEAALTLARLDASVSVGGARREAEAVFATIWQKLVEEHPDVIEVIRDANRLQRSFVASSLGYIPLTMALVAMVFAISRNHQIVRERPRGADTPTEYGFVPDQLLR